MAISAKMVNELRQKTGAGMMDCKRALQETDGDMEKAVMYLRQKGMASAGKKASRVAAEGKVEIMVADGARSGALVEVNCETDFVARGGDFQSFCKLVAGKVVDLSDEQLKQQDLFEDLRKEMVSKTNENVVVRRFQRYRLAEADQGRVECYLHMGGKIGVMVQATGREPTSCRFRRLCTVLSRDCDACSSSQPTVPGSGRGSRGHGPR